MTKAFCSICGDSNVFVAKCSKCNRIVCDSCLLAHLKCVDCLVNSNDIFKEYYEDKNKFLGCGLA
jgi:hypothetical protein